MQFELTHLVDALPGLGWTALPDGQPEFLNQRWLDYTGLTAARAAGPGWMESIHPADRQSLFEYWRSCVAAGTPGETEARMRRHDGAYRWFLFRASPVRDATGNISRWLGFNVDIEDRKRTEQALRASELSWRQIVDNIPGLVATMGPGGEVEFLNRQTLEYFGKTQQELENWSLIGAVHPDDLPGVIAARARCIETGEIYQVEHRCRGADGVYRWFQVRGLPVRNTAGAITTWYLLLTDIEDRRKAEEALRSNERNLNLIINTIPASIHVLGTDGSVLFVNQAVLDYTGLTLADVQKPDYRARIFHPEDLVRVHAERLAALRQPFPFELEMRIRGADGRYRWFLTRYSPLLDGKGQLDRWYTASFDIEVLKEAQQELHDTHAALAHTTRVMTIGELMASIAHEINQPLAGIITNVDSCLLMLANAEPNLDRARETLNRTIRDANRASEVIRRLRALFSKKETAAEPVDLTEATREVIALCSSDLQRKGIVLRTELADDLPTVSGDRIQLQQVILNLITNAADAMLGITDRPRDLIVKTELDAEQQVRVTVRDSGTGFNPRDAEKLFTSFYTTKPRGMGIGLSVSRSIIQGHHGRIWAAVNAGPGATFAFAIPSTPAS
jgi:PAS domain S-box-containing protein